MINFPLITVLLIAYSAHQAACMGLNVSVTKIGYDIDLSKHEWCDPGNDDPIRQCDYAIQFYFRPTGQADVSKDTYIVVDAQRNKWCGCKTQTVDWTAALHDLAKSNGLDARIEIWDEDTLPNKELIAVKDWYQIMDATKYSAMGLFDFVHPVDCVPVNGKMKCTTLDIKYRIKYVP